MTQKNRSTIRILPGMIVAALLACASTVDAQNCNYNIPSCTISIFGSNGNDVLCGGPASECIYGFGGNDKLCGAGANDYLVGGDGDDELYGGSSGNDLLDGGPGNDRLQGDDGNDDLWGSSGNDVLFGNSGSDNLCGEGDNDDLWGGNNPLGHFDSLDGGPGCDLCHEGEAYVNCEASCP